MLKDGAIAKRLGVSITPVREAITQLAMEGLVDLAPNRPRRVTHITHKSALELIDVMELLSCAGLQWALDNLTEETFARLRTELAKFVAARDAQDVPAALETGAEFSRILILAGGNRELQRHVDLVVNRTARLLALTGDDPIWEIWVAGYTEMMELLEDGQRRAALDRYHKIYADYRELLDERLLGRSVDTRLV